MSPTHGFKFEAPDGKQHIADVLNSDGVIILAKHYPNNRASKFLDWFTYSDNTVNGQSRKKTYTLFESGLLYGLCALGGKSYAEYLDFACNLPAENKRSDLTW